MLLVFLVMVTNELLSTQTHCDMTTAGGGWTLVASIHENDIKTKCGNADTWFSNEKLKVDNPFGK